MSANVHKWIQVATALLIAAVAFGIFGFVAYKFVGVAGIVGILFVALAVLGNFLLAKAERDLSG